MESFKHRILGLSLLLVLLAATGAQAQPTKQSFLFTPNSEVDDAGFLLALVDSRLGLTNILNTERYRGHMRPYKVVVTAGWRF